MTYQKIGPEDGSYGAAQEAKKHKRFFCDAVNHLQKGGCPNPACWMNREGAKDAKNKRQ